MAEAVTSLKKKLVRKGDFIYEIPAGTVEGQRVPVIVYISEDLFEKLEEDSLRQAVNAAKLPGVMKAIYVMPDVHVGYGFPVGGVMGTDVEEGIISPGSVGYDINCGVRLIATKLSREDVQPVIEKLMQEILKRIPAGVGSTSSIRLTTSEMKGVLKEGARWAVDRGFGFEDDLENIESGGALPEADPDSASAEAYVLNCRSLRKFTIRMRLKNSELKRVRSSSWSTRAQGALAIRSARTTSKLP